MARSEIPGQTMLGRAGALNSRTVVWSATEMEADGTGEDR